MLILNRKQGQAIKIKRCMFAHGEILIVVNAIKGNQVRIGIEAPQSVRIIRSEIEGKEVRDESGR